MKLIKKLWKRLIAEKRVKPNWCREEHALDNTTTCCSCKVNEATYQEGDGKIIHSLCASCYQRLVNVGYINQVKSKI